MTLKLVFESIYFPLIVLVFLVSCLLLIIPIFYSKYRKKKILICGAILFVAVFINFLTIYFSFSHFVKFSTDIYERCTLINYHKDKEVSETSSIQNLKIDFFCKANNRMESSFIDGIYAAFYDLHFLDQQIKRDCEIKSTDFDRKLNNKPLSHITCGRNTFDRVMNDIN